MQDLDILVNESRSYFNSGKTLDVALRLKKLKLLKSTINDFQDEILNALKLDLGKSFGESYMTEVGVVKKELSIFIKKIKKWSKPEKVGATLLNYPSKCKIFKEPYGVVLIASPWNYPFQLSMMPLIASIASGNTTILKPSIQAKNTCLVIEKIIKKIFPPEFVSVIYGENVNEKILTTRFDYIFFTGSYGVGKKIMKSASEFLTPLTLELGGKSPVICDKTCNIEVTARRICWGKFINSGQTCVAPDYILVHKDVKNSLLLAMKKAIEKLFSDPETFPKIINERRFEHLKTFLDTDFIYYGGNFDEDRHLFPTILINQSFDSPIMQEEIFGSILPVIEFDDIDKVIKILKTKEKPLALYLFSKDKSFINNVLTNLSFGSGAVGDTVMQLVEHNLPFGGVGASGFGAYHGKKSFDLFTHNKSILFKSTNIDIKLRYPPFDKKLPIYKKFLK